MKIQPISEGTDWIELQSFLKKEEKTIFSSSQLSIIIVFLHSYFISFLCAFVVPVIPFLKLKIMEIGMWTQILIPLFVDGWFVQVNIIRKKSPLFRSNRGKSGGEIKISTLPCPFVLHENIKKSLSLDLSSVQPWSWFELQVITWYKARICHQ